MDCGKVGSDCTPAPKLPILIACLENHNTVDFGWQFKIPITISPIHRPRVWELSDSKRSNIKGKDVWPSAGRAFLACLPWNGFSQVSLQDRKGIRHRFRETSRPLRLIVETTNLHFEMVAFVKLAGLNRGRLLAHQFSDIPLDFLRFLCLKVQIGLSSNCKIRPVPVELEPPSRLLLLQLLSCLLQKSSSF